MTLRSRRRLGLCAAILAVAAVTGCSTGGPPTGDLDAIGTVLIKDGEALVTDGQDHLDGLDDLGRVDTQTQTEPVRDGLDDEPCDVDNTAARRVWWTTIEFTVAGTDPSDPSVLNGVHDDVDARTAVILGDLGYTSTSSHDSDGSGPSWVVWQRGVDDIPIEFRVTSRLVPTQPEGATSLLVEVIGTTGCVAGLDHSRGGR